LLVLGRKDDGEMKLFLWIVTGLLAVAVVPLLALLVFFASRSDSDAGQTNTAAQAEFPALAYTSEESVKAYGLATERGDLLARIPCFCGCANLPQEPHESVLDCFINQDGTFDQHAAVCSLCIDIALDAANWQDEGASVAQVREEIDEKYGAFGPGTDTPPVSP
jgi:hypothetical protein